MRVGAVDCGTNSIRLLVTDLRDDAPPEEVVRRMEVVRLGQGLDATGSIAPDAMARTLAMSREYAAQCAELGVERVRFVATSASRDASNAAEFVTGVAEAFARWQIAPEVVTGDQEAQLSFDGATGELPARGVPGPYLVVDLGGGSTEFVRGDHGRVQAQRSVNIGCVRFHERFGFDAPATAGQIESATAEIDAALDVAQEAVGFDEVETLVGLAGTVTTLAAHALGLDRYDRDTIHGSVLSVQTVQAACEQLLGMSTQERADLGFMHPGRVDVIGAGALIWSRIVGRVAQRAGVTSVVTSEHDILDGIALSLAR